MTIRLIELGDDRHGLIRAVVPAPGTTGQRQVGYAMPVDKGRYLVRMPGRCAVRAGDRYSAIVLLRKIKAP